jgi:heparosan-N-sulfate-glucuronate 5-epimerase
VTGTRLLVRAPQLMAPFVPGDPQSGYYNDLREKGLEHGGPAEALTAARRLIDRRELANPVTVAQLGLGSWQLAQRDERWLEVVRHAAGWMSSELDEHGRIAYLFPMPHTYRLDPPWYSALAQGEAASLLVRASASLDEPSFLDDAVRTVESLLDDKLGLVRETPAGPILQEYPTSPPSDVLNGWIFALWGLYDVASATGDERARTAFEQGTNTLAHMLPAYDIGFDWSRYDLVPRRIPNVASPFYHRLHVEQLRALVRLAPGHAVFGTIAERWLAALRRPHARTHALLLKGLYRAGEPRHEAPLSRSLRR